MEDNKEAISAVVDDTFLAEDDDDDYEDLYNDVNVGENFQKQTLLVPKSPKSPVFQPNDVLPRADVADQETRVRVSPKVEESVEKSVSLGEKSERSLGEKVMGMGNLGGDLVIKQSLGTDLVNNQPLGTDLVNNQPLGTDLINHQTTGTMSVNIGNRVINNNNNMNNNNSNNGTMLFVGDLHWWTTDSDIENEVVKYGPVKEVRFYDEKASGKSKGYCQVEFYDSNSATLCKENMNGHLFNGRACVVAFASPFSIKRMGEAQVNRSGQGGNNTSGQVRRDNPINNNNNNKPLGNNNGVSSGGDYNNNSYGNNNNNNNGNRGGYGRGNWRGNGNMGRGGIRNNRPNGMMGRGMVGNGFNGPPMMPPQGMMGQGFDPTFGGPMGRMGAYGAFPGGPNPPFSGMMGTFPPVGVPGVAPHVNPAFFGRGMNMGMMGTGGIEGNNMGMWNDQIMGGWGSEEHGGRVAESSYAEEAVSDHQYGGEVSRDRGGGRQNVVNEKDRGSEREWSGSSDKRYRDDREPEYKREMPREKEVGHDQEWPEQRRHHDDRGASRERGREREREPSREHSRDRARDRHRGGDDRERYVDHHRYKDREPEYDDGWDRGRSSRTHSKSRLSHEEGHHFKSRDADYSKRRRLTPE